VPGSKAFGWVQLSDIHLDLRSGDADAERALIVKALIEDVRQLAEAHRVDCVLVTGDMAARGGGEELAEFDRARAFIDDLLSSLGLGPKDVLVVPGNHDVHRLIERRPVARLLAGLQDGEDLIDDVLEDSEDAAMLAERMAPAVAFARCYGPDGLAIDELGFWECTFPEQGDRLGVRLVGIDTAVCSFRQEERGKLQIPRRRLDLIPTELPPEPLVVLGHHPPAWVKHLGVYVKRGDVYLCGHEHDADGEQTVAFDHNSLITIHAGAIHSEDRPRGYGYSVCVLERDADDRLWLRWVPRRWSEPSSRFVADNDRLPEGETSGRRPLRPPPPDEQQPTLDTAGAKELTPARLHEASVLRLGGRRTAYPTDLSLGEMFDSELVVTPRLSGLSGEEALGSGRVSDWLREEHSVLLLGEPGAGKSLCTYEVLRTMASPEALAIAIDLTSYCVAMAEGDAVPDPLTCALGASGGAVADAGSSAPRLIVDGIDESLAGGVPVEDVVRAIEQLCESHACLVVCRRYDYERLLSGRIKPDLFQHLVKVLPWGRKEFSDFVGRLVRGGLLDDTSVIATVEQHGLDELTTRPLYARMLTFVASELGEVSSPSDLYATYLRKLARRVRIGEAPNEARTLTAWTTIAWELHASSALAGSRVHEQRLRSAAAAAGLDAAERTPVLEALFELRDEGPEPSAEPLHYSFYEFLVARAVQEGISAAVAGRTFDGEVLGSRELTREVRHHLVALLDRARPEGMATWLESTFDQAAALGDPTLALVRCNLLVYLAGRLEQGSTTLLARMVDEGDDPFLMNSAFWAFATQGDWGRAQEYVRRLQGDESLRSINRGYHCYYFGDAPSDVAPPYTDDASHPWRNSRGRLVEALEADLAPSDLPARALPELYTLLDFAITRTETLTDNESVAAGQVAAGLRGRIEGGLTEVLDQMLRDCV
jgi:hypothetical protein